MAEPRWLDPAEMRAWLGYRRMHALLDLQIARDLAADSGLSETDYDVLSNLSETADHKMRLTDLAAHMLWSKSRLSHHVTRMQQRGLVRREGSPADARSAVVALTDAGRKAIENAAPAHLESVRRNFIDHLTRAEIKALGELAEKVVTKLG
jgi:DNA-binding MarR family transcriptional regulator